MFLSVMLYSVLLRLGRFPHKMLSIDSQLIDKLHLFAVITATVL